MSQFLLALLVSQCYLKWTRMKTFSKKFQKKRYKNQNKQKKPQKTIISKILFLKKSPLLVSKVFALIPLSHLFQIYEF